MRCYCCDSNLSDYEATLRHPITMEFLDICKKCLPDTGIKPVEGATPNEDLIEDFEDSEEWDIDPDKEYDE